MLRVARVVVSALCLTLLTLGLLGVPALAVCARYINSIQIIPATEVMTLGVFVFWVIITVCFGRMFCSTVCPMGTLMDIVADTRRRRSYRYTAPRQATGLFMLIVAVACGIGGFVLPLSLINPEGQYVHLLNIFSGPVGWVLGVWIVSFLIVTAILVSAWLYGRRYCTHVCPVGTGLGLISRHSIMRININPDTCTRCGLCEARCKASCINIQHLTVDASRCVVCFDCLDACPDGSIRYSPDHPRLQTPMFQPTS